MSSTGNNDSLLRIPLKDWVYIVTTIFAVSGFAYSMAAKIDGVKTEVSSVKGSVEELKQNRKDERTESKVFLQQLQNQVNSNTLQIEIIKKDLQYK